jgi:hypothetical protein
MDGQLYTVQALWEESPASVEIGTVHGSSLLEDEARSALNSLLAGRIRAKEMDVSRAGLMEVIGNSAYEV